MRKVVLKTLCCFASAVLLSALPLTPAAISKTTPKSWPRAVAIGSADVGSSVFPIATGMATLITKNLKIKAVAESGQFGKSLVLMHRGDLDFGMSMADLAYEAARGLDQYKKEGKMKVRLLFSGSTSPSAFVTRIDSGITKVDQLRGKTAMISRPNNWSFTRCADIILKSAGMTRKDLKDVSFSGSKESREALLENRVDAFIAVFPSVGVSGWIKELNMERPLRLITGDEEQLNIAASGVPYASKAIFYSKYWGNMSDGKDLLTIGIPNQFLCRSDLPDDLVFEVMKAIFDNLEELKTYHPEADPYTRNPLCLSVLPYHPGAVHFYKERGLWDANLEQKQQTFLKELSQDGGGAR